MGLTSEGGAICRRENTTQLRKRKRIHSHECWVVGSNLTQGQGEGWCSTPTRRRVQRRQDQDPVPSCGLFSVHVHSSCGKWCWPWSICPPRGQHPSQPMSPQHREWMVLHFPRSTLVGEQCLLEGRRGSMGRSVDATLWNLLMMAIKKDSFQTMVNKLLMSQWSPMLNFYSA